MFKHVFSTGLTLRVGENQYEFSSPRSLEFALAGRTGLPGAKIAALLDLADDALLREAEGIRAVEQRFSQVLSRSVEVEDSTGIGAFLTELDLAMVSQDHDWRAIIDAIRHLDEDYDEYKKVALVKYMQYLTSRQEVVRSIYSARQLQRQEAVMEAESPESAHGETRIIKETLLFDLNNFKGADKPKAAELARMPKGETIEVHCEHECSVPLMLGKHRFSLRANERCALVDERGSQIGLRPGKNIVGRDSSADVVVDASYRDISRKHLIIEALPGDFFKLTDISSLGTYVPPEFLDRTVN